MISKVYYYLECSWPDEKKQPITFHDKKESVSYYFVRQKPREISEGQTFWTQEHS